MSFILLNEKGNLIHEKDLNISHHINTRNVNGLEHVEIIKVSSQVAYPRLLQSARIEYSIKHFPNEHSESYNLICSTNLHISIVYSIPTTIHLLDQSYAH